MRNDDVKVTAARVFHPPIAQSYAYRFDTMDRSIVISGDTGYSPDLIKLAKGADVLVHEVMHLGGVENLLKRVPNAAALRVNTRPAPHLDRGRGQGCRGGRGESTGAYAFRPG
jgi:L-ascorbate metabolism protein UlaG (beta-lactamase superfamily)